MIRTAMNKIGLRKELQPVKCISTPMEVYAPRARFIAKM